MMVDSSGRGLKVVSVVVSVMGLLVWVVDGVVAAEGSLEERVSRLESARGQDGDSSSHIDTRYDGGLIFERVDPSNTGGSFLMKQNTSFQTRYSHFASDGPNPDESNIEIERVRVKFAGHAYRPFLEYEVQFDIDDDDADVAELYNAFLRYVFSEPKGWDNEVALKVGLWTMPLFRQENTSSSRQMLVDRSMANEFFNIDHSVGIGLEGHVTTCPRPFWWRVAVLNGFDTDLRKPGRAGQLDRNSAYVARAYSDLIGQWGKDEESDLSHHESPAVRGGVSVGYSEVQVLGANAGEERAFRVTDTGLRLTGPAGPGVLLPGLTNFKVWLYGCDIAFKYRGLSILSELYVREIVDMMGVAVPDLMDYGYYVQAGYFVVPGKVELTSRYSQIVGDSGSLGVTDSSADEVGGGVNFYIKKHNVKIQCDVLSYNGYPASSSSAQLMPGDSGILGRVQVQLAY